MNKIIRRSVVILIVICMIGTLIPMNEVRASETEEGSVETEDILNGEKIANQEITDESEEIETEEPTEEPTEDANLNVETQENTSNSGLLNYVGVDQPYLQAPGEQSIVISWGDGSENITDMQVVCKREDGTLITMPLSKRESELYLFTYEFSKEDAGSYQATQVKYTIDGQNQILNLGEIGVEAKFGVDETYDGYKEATETNVDENVSMSVVNLDESDDTETVTSSVEEVLEEVVSETEDAPKSRMTSRSVSQQTSAQARANGNVVVVLDPGHGGSDGGASGNGVQEKDLTLKIARYCMEELEQYSGVSVYMTRYDDRAVELTDRVSIAKSYGANVLVSIHLNSAVATASGAEVWYPNANYNAEVHNQGEALAQQIQNQLVSLGLADRGIEIRSTVDDTYPDGSKQDYYSVIRNSKLNGFPGIIVEHAFVSNSGDVNNYLNSDAKLKQLGIADAIGIANYYGLTKGKPTISITEKNDYKGTCKINVSGCGTTAHVAVWTSSNQKDISWHTITGNNGEVTFDVANHLNLRGNYNVHVYDSSYSNILCNTQFRMSADTSSKLQITDVGSKETTYSISLTFADMATGVSQVYFPTWCDANQADIKWYAAQQTSPGVWTANVNVKDHNLTGTYNVHAYVVTDDGDMTSPTKGSFKVTQPNIQTLQAKNYVKNAGTFDVVLKDIVAPAGVSSLRVAVWCATGQTDLRWYDAQRQTDGSYLVQVSMADHNYSTGIYNIHAYLTTGNGFGAFNATTQEVIMPDIGVSISDVDGKETTYTMQVKNAGVLGNVSGMNFAVWSTQGGQDDLIWYSGRNSSGIWTATADIRNHKTAGEYRMDAYAILSNGSMRYVGTKKIEVSAPTVTTLRATNYNKNAGTFDVVIEGVTAPAGVASLRVPIWCAANQSDIVWYDAVRQADGSYVVRVSMANHKYSTGIYNIHMYLTTGNGLSIFKSTTQQVLLPDVSVSMSDVDGKETTYAMQVKNAGVLGNVSGMNFAVWSTQGGQDDLIWYSGRNSSGIWTATADIRNHKTAGEYRMDAYAILSDGSMKYVGTQKMEISTPIVTTLRSTNYNKNAGTFDVVIEGVTAPAGVASLRVPIWCATNQSDIVWYDAVRQADGSYVVHVSMANHKYSTGIYNIHMYLTTGNGLSIFKSTTQQVLLPDVSVSMSDVDGKETTYAMQVKNAGVLGNVSGMNFAVWSTQGGQDDLIWYSGRNSSGVWNATADIRNHKTAGEYRLDAYAILSDGSMKYVGTQKMEVSAPIVTTLRATNYNKNAGTFDVVIEGVTAQAGVASLRVPIWCAANQSDIVWYDAVRQSNGSYAVHVSMANHKYSTGIYNIHMYLMTVNGLSDFRSTTQGVELPSITINAIDKNKNETEYSLEAANVGSLGNIQTVQFAVWSAQGGQDDIVWYGTSRNGNGVWSSIANINNHKTAGTYNAHAYATLSNGVQKFVGSTEFEVSDIKGNVAVSGYDSTTGKFDVVVSGIESKSGVRSVSIPVWSISNQSDIRWYNATAQDDGTYICKVDPMYHNYNSGTYNVHAYLTANNGITRLVDYTSQIVNATNKYTIMGNTTASLEQMVRHYQQSGHTYPAAVLATGGAPDIATFCNIYIQEAAMEGVRAEVAFEQAMKETGWLQYGGIVNANQFNFAGIGALDNNGNGQCASFPDVRTGIRAQIQHLKAYASTQALVNTCVDPRFHLVSRGCAPYVEWLGQKENPTGAGWATGANYGPSIVSQIRILKSL